MRNRWGTLPLHCHYIFRRIPYPHIDVEPWFVEMVRNYPMACVLTDKIPYPQFLNADFIFHHAKIVAEFKRVEKDGTDSPKVQEKIAAVLEKYYSAAKIKEKQITEENWPSLPKEFHNEIYNITTDSIKVHVEKANKQIKATKENLGLESYKGCLILVNDGVESFPPVSFLWAAFRLILHQYSGITYIITFPANVFAKSREAPVPVQYWLGLDVEKVGKMEGVSVRVQSPRSLRVAVTHPSWCKSHFSFSPPSPCGCERRC